MARMTGVTVNPVCGTVAITMIGAQAAIRARGSGLFLDTIVDLFTMNANFIRRLDTQANLVPFDTEYRHIHIVTDDYRFTNSSGQDQHYCPLSFPCYFYRPWSGKRGSQ